MSLFSRISGHSSFFLRNTTLTWKNSCSPNQNNLHQPLKVLRRKCCLENSTTTNLGIVKSAQKYYHSNHRYAPSICSPSLTKLRLGQQVLNKSKNNYYSSWSFKSSFLLSSFPKSAKFIESIKIMKPCGNLTIGAKRQYYPSSLQKLSFNSMHIPKTFLTLRFYSRYGGRGGNSSSRRGNVFSFLDNLSPEQVIYTIIGINGAICIYWNSIDTRSADRWMRDNFTITPFLISKGYTLHTLFTSFFAHRDYMHCFLNMLTLYFFGIESAAYLGIRKFLQLYLGGGVLSSLGVAVWPAIAPYFNLRGNAFEKTLGASGAVNSVIMYSIILNPTATIYVYMILPLPAALIGVMFLAKDFMGLLDGTSSVSHTAHLAGAAYGGLFYLLTKGRGGGGGRGFYQRWR